LRLDEVRESGDDRFDVSEGGRLGGAEVGEVDAGEEREGRGEGTVE